MSSNAEYSLEEIRPIIQSYITHRAEGWNKETFPECDYRTIERHIELYPELQAEKRALDIAERKGFHEWEKIGKDLSTGKVEGNATAWIFTVKNKLGWSDKQTIEVNQTKRVIMTNDDGSEVNTEDTDL